MLRGRMKENPKNQETSEITQKDIPIAMKLLEVSTPGGFAKMLGITERSLRDGPMAIWRQMSIECLLRRAGKWEEFCDLRGATPSTGHDKPIVTGYHCIVCSQCVEHIHRVPPPKRPGN